MNKNALNILLCIALLATGSAAASEFSGAYVGGKVGGNRSDMSGVLVAPAKNATTYGLQGGYNWDLENFLLGADGFYDANSSTSHAAASSYGSSVYGLDLKLGWLLNQWMPYARLGFAKVGGSGSASAFSGSDAHLGIGVEYKFLPSWSVAGEWTSISARNNGTKMVNNNLTIGINYYFGAPVATAAVVAVPVVAATPKPEPKPEPKAEAQPQPQPKEVWKSTITEKPVRLEGASFASGSAKLLQGADQKLDEVVAVANQHPEIMLEVSGYTDNRGDAKKNQRLSENRAAAVKQYMVSKGVAADRITAKGYGADNPIADNKTAVGRATNRRVEVHYVLKEEKRFKANE